MNSRPPDPTGPAPETLDQPSIPGPTSPMTASDAELLTKLRQGDEVAFATLVDAWSPAMLRLARTFVSTTASADEVVQETWLAFLRGLAGFQGRSTLRTWTFRILTNIAKTRGVRESRTVPWSSLSLEGEASPTVDPHRFRGPEDEWAGHWTDAGAPQEWEPPPESEVIASEVRAVLAAALDQLPSRQRTVVSLRDVHGLSSDEVCEVLGVSAGNQRVLLHRARARLREVLEVFYASRGTVLA